MPSGTGREREGNGMKFRKAERISGTVKREWGNGNGKREREGENGNGTEKREGERISGTGTEQKAGCLSLLFCSDPAV